MIGKMNSIISKKSILRKIASSLIRSYAILGTNRLCYSCGKSVGHFLSYRGGWKNVPRLIVALDVIGSDVENFSCPYCGAHDRERHLLMYFDRASVWEKIEKGNILHFAPEKTLIPRILSAKPEKYIKADLLPRTADIVREDITQLSFANCTFDLVIANHVLEHVSNDISALAEIYRVLKPGGYAILQTPYSAKLHRTWEDAGINTDITRLQAFGQEDHSRLFGCDIFDRFTSVGLQSLVASHDQLLPEIDPVMYGINAREPFFLFRRRQIMTSPEGIF